MVDGQPRSEIRSSPLRVRRAHLGARRGSRGSGGMNLGTTPAVCDTAGGVGDTAAFIQPDTDVQLCHEGMNSRRTVKVAFGY